MKKNNELTDNVLRLQQKYDAVAFREVYDKLSPKLYFLTIRYLKDTDKAKDALQEIFITIHEKIKQYEGKGSFEGWCKRIAIYHCIGVLKKEKHLFELKDTNLSTYEQEDFDQHEQTKAVEAQLKKALSQLPTGYRTIINLNVIEGYSHPEIAEMLQINEGTSRSQLNRAKRALRELMTRRK